MKFVITGSTVPGAAVIQRFLATGAQPPAGVKMLSRYHALTGSQSGFIVAESADAKGIHSWLCRWWKTATRRPSSRSGSRAGRLLRRGRHTDSRGIAAFVADPDHQRIIARIQSVRYDNRYQRDSHEARRESRRRRLRRNPADGRAER